MSELVTNDLDNAVKRLTHIKNPSYGKPVDVDGSRITQVYYTTGEGHKGKAGEIVQENSGRIVYKRWRRKNEY